MAGGLAGRAGPVPRDRYDWAGQVAALATQHGKQRVIAPLMRRLAGIRVVLADGVDTDSFGTFSRDVARTGSAIEAARAKVAAAFVARPDAPLAMASEGSFAPDPMVGTIPVGHELILLTDRTTGTEVCGHHADWGATYAHRVVGDPDAALAFARGVGFPAQGVIVLGTAEGEPQPDLMLVKDIADADGLAAAVRAAVARCGGAWIETDMRAHRNPRRMRAIRRAALDLVRALRSRCPDCRRPGFVVTGRVTGLPCAGCGSPTVLARAEMLTCAGCGHRQLRPTARTAADPGHCEWCNP